MRIILSCILLLVLTVYADPVATFDEAVRLYDAKDFAGAAGAFEAVLSEGAANYETYFNLGNTYFRLNQFGKAILNYERASRYRQNDPELRQNLAEARRHIVDRIEPPIRLVIWDWLDQFRQKLGLFQLSVLALILGAFSAILVAVRAFVAQGRGDWLRRARTGSIALFALSAVWYIWAAADFGRAEAVVLVEKVDVYSAPDSGSKQLFTLHEGTKVAKRQAVSGWTNIRLVDGREGWISASSIDGI